MKMSLAAAAAVVGAASMVLTGCSTGESTESGPDVDYDVTGVVDLRWVEYECDSHALSMEPMAYDGRTGGSSGGSRNSNSGSSDSGSGSSSGSSGSSNKDRPRNSTSNGGTTGGTTNTVPPSRTTTGDKEKKRTASPAPATTTPAKKRSVTLPTGKPMKPKNYNSKRCDTEYELYINNSGTIYEQDVPQEHYDLCGEKKKFPACALAD